MFFRPVVAAWGDVQWETAKVSDRKPAASGVSTFTGISKALRLPELALEPCPSGVGHLEGICLRQAQAGEAPCVCQVGIVGP